LRYRLYFYETNSQKPVEKFINKLQPSSKAKVVKELDLLAEYGVQLVMPHAKPIGSGLYELRIRDKQEVRLIYLFFKGDNIYILHAFFKKSNAIPAKELDKAKRRAKEILRT